jgi:type IX secretion system PorP/SprF family membrane protein
MKTKFLLFVLIVAGTGTVNAQHYSLYSQYIINQMAINPAYAGKNEILEATLMHRRQWMGFNGYPNTTSVGIHSPLENKSKTNVGLNIIDDRVGVVVNQYLSGVYAYRFQVKNTFCSFGVQAGLNITRADWEGLKRNEANDAVFVNQQKSRAGFVSGVGYYMHNDLFFAGVSMPYLMNTNGYKSIGSSPVLINGGYNVGFRDSSILKPSVLFRYVPGSPFQFDLNLNYYWRQKFGGGISYRYQESIVVILEYTAQKDFRVGYSYDLGIGKLGKYHNGSHELLIRFFIRLKKKAEETTTEDPK